MVLVIGNWRPTSLWSWNLKRPCGIVPHLAPKKPEGGSGKKPQNSLKDLKFFENCVVY
jgi:hypothetical protein